ncbi:Alpha/Beta hydrolase protein [Aspergillus nidulans var. acristatus]
MSSDLFPGFSSQYVTTTHGARIFVRVSPTQDKPPLLLVHGFPQTHAEWHKLTPLLTPHFTVVLVDLRGYGASSIPASANGSGYTKRLMGQDCLSVMDQLGYANQRFAVVGHDRGARVAYRLAFDNPERLSKVVVVDVVPTAAMFARFGNPTAGLKAYHWLFLAQPEPFPEKMIGKEDKGRLFLEQALSSWTAAGTLQAFSDTAMERYREAYCDEQRIHATCEDYRAGAYFDRVYDEEDLEKGNKIQVPVLAVWGEEGGFTGPKKSEAKKEQEGPLEVWQRYCVDLRGKGLNCGHFIPEEDPQALADEILQFLL